MINEIRDFFSCTIICLFRNFNFFFFLSKNQVRISSIEVEILRETSIDSTQVRRFEKIEKSAVSIDWESRKKKLENCKIQVKRETLSSNYAWTGGRGSPTVMTRPWKMWLWTLWLNRIRMDCNSDYKLDYGVPLIALNILCILGLLSIVNVHFTPYYYYYEFSTFENFTWEKVLRPRW